MKRFLLAACVLSMADAAAHAQAMPGPEQVEMEWMTSPEIYVAMHEHGKTTAIVFTGGTEQRGPHAVLAGHTIMARALAVEIARKLGNALVAPVLPFSPTSLVGPKIPGGIALSGDLFAKVNEEVGESLITGGFKTVVFMGDHGSGQAEVAKMAAALDAKHVPEGVRVIFCKDVYEKARAVFDDYAKSTMKEGFAYGTHAGLYDTSLLLYFQPKPEAYVRNNYKTVTPHPGPAPGPPRDRSLPRAPREARAPAADSSEAVAENGVQGDPRYATAELGKKMMEIKVQLAVDEIHRDLAVSAAK